MGPATRAVAVVTSLIAVVALTFAIQLRCTAERPRPRQPEPIAAPPTWYWYTALNDRPWHLPERIWGLALLDPKTAVAVTETSILTVDLATGEVSPLVEAMPAAAWMTALARVGDRVIAFGRANDKPAAWEISANGAVALAVDDPKPEEPKGLTGGGAAASPDGAYVVHCTDIRPPTLRDGRTLKAIRVLPNEGCGRVWFEDATHFVLDNSGRRTRFDVDGSKRRIDDDPIARTTPNGKYVVVEQSDAVTIRSNSASRTVKLPDNWWSEDVALDDRTLLLVRGLVLLAVDLEAGTVRQPAGSPREALWIAPHDGMILTAPDGVRAYRGDTMIAAAIGDRFATAGRHEPVLLVDHEIASWDPLTNERTLIRKVDKYPSVVEHGIVQADKTLFRLDDGSRWLTLDEKFSLEHVDATRTKLAGALVNGWAILDTAAERVWQLGEHGVCDEFGPVMFSPDGSRFAAQSKDRVVVFDSATYQRLAEVPLGEHTPRWTMVTNDEIVVARQYEVELWDLRTRRSKSWLPPAKNDARQIVAGDEELAIQYDRDELVWVDMAGLRTHAKPGRDIPAMPPQQCWVAPAPAYNELVKDRAPTGSP